MSMFLGIEIGGTKLQLGVGPGDGTLRGLWRGDVDVAAGGEGIRRQIVAAVPELLTRAGLDRSHLKAAGIGFGGPVDDATRSVIKSHQIEGWDGFPLAAWVEDLVGLPTALGNDADVAGLAEALYGAGRGLSPVFYVTIGSGIGGGLSIDGSIYRGAGRGAAEVGHLRVGRGRDGEDATLEALASGWSIVAEARHRAALPENSHSLLWTLAGGDADRITGPVVAEAARAGDLVVAAILHRACSALADALCHVIALVCPRRIVVGGGVSLMGEDVLFEPLRRMVAERVFRPFADCYEIVPAALGEAVVLHGALALARQQLEGVR
jgi:glucokinase